jgi:CO dehydrogenase nickel-insertion accessory protein CooC1
MNKAEERALEAYPKMSMVSEPHGLIPADNKFHYLGDGNEGKRVAYIKGYHQAEKDNVLTWENMRELHIIFAEIDVDIELCKTNIKTETLGYYQEVLKRFKNFKERKENEVQDKI